MVQNSISKKITIKVSSTAVSMIVMYSCEPQLRLKNPRTSAKIHGRIEVNMLMIHIQNIKLMNFLTLSQLAQNASSPKKLL